MTRADMIANFKKHTNGLAGTLTDGEVQVYLDRFYQFVVPSDVDGRISEGTFTFYTNTATSNYSILSSVVSLNRSKAWIETSDEPLSPTNPLSIMYSFRDFVVRFPSYQDGTKKSLPHTICIFGNKIYTNAVPNIVVLISIEGRVGPSAALTLTGLPDEIHAMAVVTGAAWNFLMEQDDEVSYARESALYAVYKSMLNTRSVSRYQRRRSARSF